MLEYGIKNYNDNDYLLYHSLGIVYNRLNQFDKAEAAFLNALNINRNHAGSTFGLGISEFYQNNRVQSLCALFYFLMLEPSSQRAKTAYELLQNKQIKAFKIGREYRIPKICIIEYFLNNEKNFGQEMQTAYN